MMQDYGTLVQQLMNYAEPVGDVIDARKRFFMGEVPGLPAIGPITGGRGGRVEVLQMPAVDPRYPHRYPGNVKSDKPLSKADLDQLRYLNALLQQQGK